MSESVTGPAATGDSIAEALERNNKLLTELVQLQKFAMTGPQRICEIIHEQHKILVHVPFGDIDYIQRKLVYNRSFYEIGILEKLRKRLPERATICDIGANIGNHTLYFAICCAAEHVFAFEPLRTNFDILSRNIKLNQLTNVTAIQRPIGIANERGSVANYKLKNTGATSFVPSKDGEFVYMSLDELALDRLDLVKIDVEGRQEDAVRGSQETLRRLRPLVVVEARPAELAQVTALMEDIGMTLVERLGAFDFLYRFE